MSRSRTPRKKAELPTTVLRGEVFVHRYLWHAYEHFAAEGKRAPDGPALPNVAALLMLYFAFEGFLNCLGSQAYPDTWQRERAFFTGGKYPGTLGKLDYLAEQLGLPLDRGKRPYQTLKELDERRDAFVHPRIEQILREVKVPNPDWMPSVEPLILSIAEPAFVRRAGKYVEGIADTLQAAAIEQHGSTVIYGDRAFRGSVWYQYNWLPSPIDG
jgi:hypothetical protein